MTGNDKAAGARTHRGRKSELRSLLAERNLSAVIEWIEGERHPMRPLSSLLFDADELVRWRAIEALGVTAAHEWRSDHERVRRQIRRLYWLMNDESGGICWNAPEAIAEILYNVPGLIGEYGLQLPSYFIEEPFERGSRWAVARLAAKDASAFTFAGAALADSLGNRDAVIRGLSLMALRRLGDGAGRKPAASLTEDTHPLKIYDFKTGKFVTSTVGDEARAYLGLF